MSNFFEENLHIKYSEMDLDFALKPFSLLNFLQDIASNNAEELGFGYSFISSKNLAWFLIKYRMEFDEYPVGVYDLILKTRPRGYNRLFAYREFELFEQEKRLGRVFSAWSLVDVEKRSPVAISSFIPNNVHMLPFEKRNDDLIFSKIKQIENPILRKEFEVRYNDIDVNGHANNGNYIVWALEPLALEYKLSNKIKTLDMVFKKEVKYGEKIIVDIEFKDDNNTVHRLQNSSGEDLCLIECVWK